MTIYLSASDSVVSAKDGRSADSTEGSDKIPARTSIDDEETPIRLPRSASVQSYGSVDFAQRAISRHRSGRSVDSGLRTPLLAQSLIEEDGHKTPTQRQPYAGPTVAPRKVMYFAAGSGIPEIKTLLSGFVIRGYLGAWTL
jgi:hypothetical protein